MSSNISSEQTPTTPSSISGMGGQSTSQQQRTEVTSSGMQPSASGQMGTMGSQTQGGPSSTFEQQQQPMSSSSTSPGESITAQQQPSASGASGPSSGSGGVKEAIPIAVHEGTQQRIEQGMGKLGQGQQIPVSRAKAHGQYPFMRTVLVTGATGSTGCALLTLLSKMPSRNFNVVVGSHGPVSAKCQDLFNQFENVYQLDASVPQSLDFSGIDELLIIPPNTENRLQQVENYAHAAKRAGVKFILLLSILGTETRTFDNLFTQQFRRMEDVVEQTDIPCCFVRSNLYMENLFFQAPIIRDKQQIALPLRQGRWAPIAVQDVARVLACILSQPEPHINKAYDLSGPELLNGFQIAQILSKCASELHKGGGMQEQQQQSIGSGGAGTSFSQLSNLEFTPCNLQNFVNMLQVQNVDRWLACGLADYLDMLDKDKSLESVDAREFFVELTGEDMTTLAQWWCLHADHFVNIIAQAPQLQQQQQQRQMGMGGMASTDTTMSKLKSLLHELISERSDFTLEEKKMIERNEERLRQLHQLEKQIGGLDISGQSFAQPQQGYSQTGGGGGGGALRGREFGRGQQQPSWEQQQQPSWEQQQQQPSWGKQQQQTSWGKQQQQPSWEQQRGIRESGIAGGRGGQYAEGGLEQKMQTFGERIGKGSRQQQGYGGGWEQPQQSYGGMMGSGMQSQESGGGSGGIYQPRQQSGIASGGW